MSTIASMFQIGYVLAELRRRMGRTILTALGLAAGVGLVVGVVGVSQGLEQAQEQVLSPLTSVGTDVLVTRVAGAQPSGDEGPEDQDGALVEERGPGLAGQGGRGQAFFLGQGRGPGASLNDQDTAELLRENQSVVTDLASLGKPGEQFERDFFLSGTLLSFPEEALDQIAKIDGVESVTAGLSLLATHQKGTVPEIVAELQAGGQEVTTTVRPEPLTAQEQAAFRDCVVERGGVQQGEPQAQPAPPGQGGQPGGAVILRGRAAAFQECLPQRLREFQASVLTPLQTIRQLVDPPSTDITSTNYTVAGVDISKPDEGLITRNQLSDGRYIESPDEVLVAVAYADKNGLAVGDTLTINGRTFKVAGLVTPTMTGSTADVYFELAALQALAKKEGRLTQIMVQASDAAAVDRVAAAIETALPGAEVLTTKELADSVTGSLADAKSVADRLGGALAAIVLAAAFAIAALLTLSSVAKRVREIGTLRAIGWSKLRVVGQVVSETAAIGVVGGIVGVGIGVLTAMLVGQFAPELTASSAGVPGIASSSLASLFNQTASTATESTMQLEAPVRATTMAAGVGLAVVGGLLAGALGGWRAARLSPARALGNVG